MVIYFVVREFLILEVKGLRDNKVLRIFWDGRMFSIVGLDL